MSANLVNIQNNQLNSPSCCIKGVRGLAVISTLALFVISIVALSSNFPSHLFGYSVVVLSAVRYFSTVLSKPKGERGKTFAVEFLLSSVSMALGLMFHYQALTLAQAALGLLVVQSTAILRGVLFGKDEPRPIEAPLEGSFARARPLFILRWLNYGIGLMKDCAYLLQTVISRISHRVHYSENIVQSGREGLVVLIHGLNGSPAIFDRMWDRLHAHQGDAITLFQPNVHRKGICPLDEARDELFNEIASWSDLNPTRPIVLIGASNGARLAGALAAKLKSAGHRNPIQASCIAGPFNGTTQVNGMGRCVSGMILRKYGSEVFSELSYPSERGGRLIAEMQQAAQNGVSFNFYGSFADTSVAPIQTTSPLVANAHYFTVNCEGHQSIVRAVEENVVSLADQFLYTHRPII